VHISGFIDALRPADWRHKRCTFLVESGRQPSRRRDDKPTWGAWRYLSALRRCNGERDRQRVVRRYAAIDAAHQLRFDTDSMVRWHIQGWLFAGVAPTEIDEHFHLRPGTTRAFADQFLDVLHCLHARIYLVNVVIGLHCKPITEDDAERLLLLYGLGLGRHVVDSLVDFFIDPEPIPDEGANVEPERLARVISHLRVRAAIEARCRPVCDRRPQQIGLLAQRLDFRRHNGIDLLESPKIDVPNDAEDAGTSEKVLKYKIPDLQAA